MGGRRLEEKGVEVVLGTDGGGLVVGRRRRWSSCRSKTDLWLHHTAAFPGLLYNFFFLVRNVALSINAGGIIDCFRHRRASLLLSPSVAVLLLLLRCRFPRMIPSKSCLSADP